MADFDASLPDAPGKHATVRQEIEHALESAGALFKASMRPLPTQTGDGSYLAPPQITGLIKDLQKMGIDDAETLIELVKSTATGEKINDKSYFMERLIKLASELPVTSKNGVRLTNSLVNKLWSDLQHPPSTFLGEEYIYRRADGSNNVYNHCWSHARIGSLSLVRRTSCNRRLEQPIPPTLELSDPRQLNPPTFLTLALFSIV